MRVEKVLLASPRGFCAGVEMAIKALAWMVRAAEPPGYCYHEIVHNQVVVDRFRQLGVVFVDDVSEVPPGRPLMLSAHGSAPDVVAAARANGGAVVDAVCPLVTKVHHEVKLRASKGYSIVYVGHEGHEEAVGTIAVAPDAIHRVESVAELMALPDLCFATTNRQAALRAIAARCDTMVVIGSANSSNTLALVRTAKSAGCPRALRVNTAAELPDDLSGVVGVIAGASAPESLVEEVLRRLAPIEGTEEVRAVPEDEYFPLPRELREVLRGVAAVIGAVAFAPPPPTGAPDGPEASVDGRDLSAALVLAALG